MLTDKPTPFKIKPALRKWLRIIHRNLGYAMAGLCIVYGVSGILLNHIQGSDPAFRTSTATLHIAQNLTADELATIWNNMPSLPSLKKVIDRKNGQYSLMLNGGTGVYTTQTGNATYEQHTKRQFVYWINRLHYNRVKGWTPMADIFAGSLIFLALSGLFLVPSAKGIRGSGKWYLLAGIIIPIIYLILW
ncbi:MAG: PepSY-associated TM helix domain-containing protein [Cytophagaceae bacterium]|jgi:hypothetical protein|nr:PepSY-associated TM helix domain-containing protein [Cytophagaceae bacterium]